MPKRRPFVTRPPGLDVVDWHNPPERQLVIWLTGETGSSRVEPGQVPAAAVTLSWATFSDAADEAGLSRRYGGIHFVEGDLRGREIGRRIGRQAWHKAKTYFRPTVAFPAMLARSEEAALEPAS